MAVYVIGNGNDYRIWRTAEGGTSRTHAPHKDDGSASPDRDTLTSVEKVRFGEVTDSIMDVDSGLAFDTAELSVADDAPSTLNATVGMNITAMDVSDWFEGGITSNTTYSISGGTGNEKGAEHVRALFRRTPKIRLYPAARV